MALSGYFEQAYAGGKVIMRIDWSATQDAANNQSTITATAKLKYQSSEDVYQRYDNTFRIDGDEYKFLFPSNPGGEWGTEFTLYTKSKTVTHDGAGARSVALYCEYRLEREIFGYTLGSVSVSGTAELDSLATASRFASVTASVEVNGNNACAVTIARATGTVWHKVRYLLNSTYQYTTGAVETGASYVIPMTWLNALPNATTGIMTVTLTTYRDQALTQQVGDPVSRNVTLKVPASVKPAVAAGWASVSAYNDNATVAGWGVYLQGYSQAQVAFDQTKETLNLYGATIASRKIVYGTQTVSASPYRTAILTAAGSQTITAVITDTRGRTASQALTFNVEQYARPTPVNPQMYRSNSSGQASTNGTYIAILAGISYSSAGNHNSASLRARYRATGGSWSSWESVNAGAVTVIGGGGILTTSTYDVQLQAIDTLGSTNSVQAEIGTKTVALHIRDGGTGMGLGKYGETDGALEIGWPLTPGSDAIRRATLAAFSPRTETPRYGVMFYASLEEMGATADMTTQAFGTNVMERYEMLAVALATSAIYHLTDVPAEPGVALFMRHEASVYGLLLAQNGNIYHYYYNGYTQTGAWKQITSA